MLTYYLKFHFHYTNNLRDLLTATTSCSLFLLKGANILVLSYTDGILEGSTLFLLHPKDAWEDKLGALSRWQNRLLKTIVIHERLYYQETDVKKKKKSYFKGKEERRYRVREKQKGSKVSGRTWICFDKSNICILKLILNACAGNSKYLWFRPKLRAISLSRKSLELFSLGVICQLCSTLFSKALTTSWFYFL